MATIEISPVQLLEQKAAENRRTVATLSILSLLTVAAIVVQGYHPYAEDGGIYVPGIEKLVHPELFPAWSEFVSVQARFSAFPQLVATLVRLTGIDLMAMMLLLHILSIWAVLFAAWRLTSICYRNRRKCYTAVALLACCLSMPIAGTSLMLMDPYVTARSFSTPLGVLAIATALGVVTRCRRYGTVDRREVLLCVFSLIAAALVHPLMAGYALMCVALLACMSFRVSRWRVVSSVAVCLFSVALAAVVENGVTLNGIAYELVAKSRNYWFLSTWHWYEQIGLVAPLIVIALLWLSGEARSNIALSALATMGIAAGLTASLVAIAFARESSPSYSVAMLQPLRVFQIVYILMILALGGAMGEWLLRRPWRGVVTLSLLASLMGMVQLKTFPNSAHLEVPWCTPRNGWESGFLWIRTHTPTDAVFALDSSYIDYPGEDTQNFRAIAQRSTLPDYFKDGGIAAIAPDLASDWLYGVTVQHSLSSETDAQRDAKLRDVAAQWLVLPENAKTSFECVYTNESMKICKLR